MIWESCKNPFLLVSFLTLQNEIFTLVVKSLLEKEYITLSPVKRIDNRVTVIVVNSRNEWQTNGVCIWKFSPEHIWSYSFLHNKGEKHSAKATFFS